MSDSSYDSVPYSSRIHRCTHPRLLATLASLYGLPVPSLAHCRVLELGCAKGDNLIAMAQVMPSCEFVGVDYVETQIESAKQAVAALGLKNVRFVTLDIRDHAGLGEFDFILAHGLYSWVPVELQTVILGLCKERLSPQGLAYISYNALPGGYQRQLIRDVMRFGIAEKDDVPLMVEQGRSIVAALARMTEKMPAPSNQILHQECAQAAQLEPSYLYHDFLEANNNPIYFHQFASSLAEHGLQYVTDTLALSRGLLGFGVDAGELSINSVVEREQYFDFLFNTVFRRSLICHDDVAVQERPVAENLMDKRLALLAPRDKTTSAIQYVTTNGVRLTLQQPDLVRLLARLEAAMPATLSVAELLADIDSSFHQQVLDWLVKAVSNECLAVQMHADDFVCTVTAAPEVSALARYQAQFSCELASLRHDNVGVSERSRAIVPFLDGSRTITELQSIYQGQHAQAAVDDNELNDRLRHDLEWLARAALLRH